MIEYPTINWRGNSLFLRMAYKLGEECEYRMKRTHKGLFRWNQTLNNIFCLK